MYTVSTWERWRIETRTWEAALLSGNEVMGVYALPQRDVQNEVIRVPTAPR